MAAYAEAIHVSIPYRFNESSLLLGILLCNRTFQFLIGSMKDVQSTLRKWYERFQFLIGSMKEQSLPLFIIFAILFQFLIGSMKEGVHKDVIRKIKFQFLIGSMKG